MALDNNTIELITTNGPADIAELVPDLLSNKAKRELFKIERQLRKTGVRHTFTSTIWGNLTEETQQEIIEAAQEL